MARISIDNGNRYYDIDELDTIARYIDLNWDALVDFMDDDTREAVHFDLAPCTNLEFLAEYLRRAPYDLVIG